MSEDSQAWMDALSGGTSNNAFVGQDNVQPGAAKFMVNGIDYSMVPGAALWYGKGNAQKDRYADALAAFYQRHPDGPSTPEEVNEFYSIRSMAPEQPHDSGGLLSMLADGVKGLPGAIASMPGLKVAGAAAGVGGLNGLLSSSLGSIGAPTSLAEEMARLGIADTAGAEAGTVTGGSGSVSLAGHAADDQLWNSNLFGPKTYSGAPEVFNGAGYNPVQPDWNSNLFGPQTYSGPGSSLYETAGATGVGPTGVSAIDAPGMVRDLASGGMTLPPGVWDTIKSYGPTAVQAVQKLLQGGAGADTLGGAGGLMALLGKVAPAALGAFASNQQANNLAAVGEKYFNVGAPSRARYEASYAPGFTMMNDPGYKDALDATTKATLHGLSVTGNPAGSPNAWDKTLTDVNAKFAYPALQNYRSTNAGAGGLAALTGTAPTLDTAAVNAGKGVYDAVGAGAADIFNPKKSLAESLMEFERLRKATGG